MYTSYYVHAWFFVYAYFNVPVFPITDMNLIEYLLLILIFCSIGSASAKKSKLMLTALERKLQALIPRKYISICIFIYFTCVLTYVYIIS